MRADRPLIPSFQSFTSFDEAATGDLIPARTLYSSAGWLRLLDRHGHGYTYVLVRQGHDAVLIPVTEGVDAHARRYHPEFLLAGHVPAEACVVVGPRTGYRNELLSSMLPFAADAVVESLQDAARGRVVLLPYLSSADAARFTAVGHPAGLVAWEAWLDVPESGFDGYLESVGQSRRRQIKADLKQVARNGLAFQVIPLDEDAPVQDIARLLVLHEKKYDPSYNRPPSEFVPYLALCANVPGAYVILARLGERVVGCHVVFHYADVLWVRLFGVDESLEQTRSSYFSLMFYEPLKFAHLLGASAVHLGIAASETKLRRGARLEPLWTVALAGDDDIRQRVRQGLLSRSRELPDPVPASIIPPDTP
ncbi:GNAT family N-acetyltransferase [Streptomyces ferrugineus]|uniref:GNAT family N-acetyltransferase n=1 Tax=Streptomyces ferrugineus TaxID=1413221 RepID=A0A7M2SLV1_9ACTN|nr:GNAT family N-acetyltransferase [Streptomyces ferrugineus]QOV37340.1 GNAT family N-acetyltransferase [Streptomyces ferrugineus]